MKKHTAHLLCAAASSLLFSAQSAQAAQTLTEGLTTGSSIKVNVRTRYEDVSWDGLSDADALTIRSRLSYQSGAWNGFAVTAEMDNVTNAEGDVDYATWGADPLVINGKKAAPIFDPQGTDFNQASISYSTFNNVIRYGRQRIVLDNARFIGNVGWRQNEQTYDGLSFTNKSLRYTNIFVAHINNVNRIFGDANALQGDYKQDTNLINVSYSGFEAGKLTGYAYLIDNLADDYLKKLTGGNANAISNDTVGVRWSSTANPAFMYTLEYAKQSNGDKNPTQYDTDYKFIEVSTTLGRFVPALGYEVLGSDNGKKGFITPFATLHAFNGWADRFLVTPVNGLQDMYVNLGATFSGVALMASYHDYQSEVKSIDYGTEWNFSATKKFGAVTYMAKYAMFENDKLVTTAKSDTSKIWLQADWNF